jgi:putative N6-adenine-specific DNA methylase
MAIAFFSAFGSVLKNRFAGWTVCLFTADLTLPRMLRLKESKKTPFFNGAIECRLFRFEMVAGSNRKNPSAS